MTVPEPNNKPTLSADQINKLIENQSRQFEIQLGNQKVKEQQTKSNEAIALKAIDAQERDNRHEREIQLKSGNYKILFACFLCLIFVVSGFYCLEHGHKDLLADVAKFLAGGGAGFGIGRYYKSKRSGYEDVSVEELN